MLAIMPFRRSPDVYAAPGETKQRIIWDKLMIKGKLALSRDVRADSGIHFHRFRRVGHGRRSYS